MTVKELRQLLEDAPNDMGVYVNRDSALGGFVFELACVNESGIAVFGDPDESQGEVGDTTHGFIIMAHGSTVSEDDIDEDEIDTPPPVLN